jgi:asparagine synthase (glutamine-hydrolysing)
MLSTDGSVASVYPLLRQVLGESQCRSILSTQLLDVFQRTENPYAEMLKKAFAESKWAGTLTQVSYAEGRTYMHDVLLNDTDQMSMVYALEVRVPFLDHKLVEYVMGVSDDHKRPNGTPKTLLVESLKGMLPDEVVHRPKQGFTLPFDPWMRGALRGFCEERLSPKRVNSRGIFRAGPIGEMWKSFLNGRPDVTWSRLWILVVLEDWLERNNVTLDHESNQTERNIA